MVTKKRLGILKERQKLRLAYDDNEDGDDDGIQFHKKGIRIPNGFRSKDMAYSLFHNDKAYRLSYLNSCFHLLI